MLRCATKIAPGLRTGRRRPTSAADMRDEHFYEPAQGHGLAHDPLNAIVAPRPIGWISTVSAAGVRNLAPYSFFNLFNYRPPILGFASIGPDTIDDAHRQALLDYFDMAAQHMVNSAF